MNYRNVFDHLGDPVTEDEAWRLADLLRIVAAVLLAIGAIWMRWA